MNLSTIPVAPWLINEIETVILGPMTDGRVPLPRRLKPVPGFDEAPEQEKPSEAVLQLLTTEERPMQIAHIATRTALDEADVTRALMVLRLAGRVDKVAGDTGRMRDWQWRAAA